MLSFTLPGRVPGYWNNTLEMMMETLSVKLSYIFQPIVLNITVVSSKKIASKCYLPKQAYAPAKSKYANKL